MPHPLLTSESEIIKAWKKCAKLKWDHDRAGSKYDFVREVSIELGVSERTLQRAIAKFEIRGILQSIYDSRKGASVSNGRAEKRS